MINEQPLWLRLLPMPLRSLSQLNSLHPKPILLILLLWLMMAMLNI